MEREIVFVAAITPPPVTGMTVMTERIVEALQDAGPIKFWNWSPGHQPTRVQMRTVRFLRTVGSVLRLLAKGPVPGNRFYVLANAKAGLTTTLALVAVARFLGHRIYIHHHTYVYIDRYSRVMALICRCMGDRGVHIVHCEKMIDDFRRQYPTADHYLTICPSIVAVDIQQSRLSPSVPMKLGMISNLTIDKGVDLAIETFRALRRSGRAVELTLAGPIQSPAAKKLVDAAVAEYPDAVHHVGPVYGDDKMGFLANIDVLLFPTRYPAESWGIVLDEAQAVGAPVITFDRGCTATVVGSHAGLVIPRDGDYVAEAVAQIQTWMENPAEYRDASGAAVQQETRLQQEGHRQLQEFAAHMFSPLDEF